MFIYLLERVNKKGVMGMSERIMYRGLLMSADQLRDALTMIAKESDELNKEVNRLDALADKLEQQLKTARKEAFIAGANQYYLGPHMKPHIEEKAEEYANNLEGK